jgi:Cytochrome c
MRIRIEPDVRARGGREATTLMDVAGDVRSRGDVPIDVNAAARIALSPARTASKSCASGAHAPPAAGRGPGCGRTDDPGTGPRAREPPARAHERHRRPGSSSSRRRLRRGRPPLPRPGDWCSRALVPPERPSPAPGATLFHDNCTGCHGITGAGDGADVAWLGITPANVTDRVHARRDAARRGQRHHARPPQERHAHEGRRALRAAGVGLVAYLWSLSSSPAAAAYLSRTHARRGVPDGRSAS